MKRLALATALTLSLAAPAFANDQLARSLGVNADDYTLAQLVDLRSATEDDDWFRVNAIKQDAANTGVNVSTKNGVSASGTSQLEASLGVEPGSLSLAQLIDLRAATDDDDHFRANAIRQQAGSNGVTASSKGSGQSGGVSQLEASLGVEPGLYTSAELIALRAYVEDDNWFQANEIRKQVKGNRF